MTSILSLIRCTIHEDTLWSEMVKLTKGEALFENNFLKAALPITSKSPTYGDYKINIIARNTVYTVYTCTV